MRGAVGAAASRGTTRTSLHTVVLALRCAGRAGVASPRVSLRRVASSCAVVCVWLPRPTAPSALKSFLSGGCGGVCLVAVGHPLDLIKVRLQTMPQPAPGQPPMYTGMGDVFRKTVATDGVRKRRRRIAAVVSS